MKKLLTLSKEKCLGWFAITTLITLSVQFWALNKGLIMSDDGWFACLLRDQPTNLVTQYHLLFGNLFHNSIYAQRLFAFVVKVISIIVLSWGMTTFYLSSKTSEFNRITLFVFFFCIIVLGQMTLGPLSVSYAYLSLFVVESSLGLLLIALAKNSYIVFGLSGFIFAFLFPIKITALLAAPLFILVIYCCVPQKKDGSIVAFIAGFILSVLLYFLFIQSFPDYLSVFQKNVSSTINKGHQDYGIYFLFEWLKSAFVYYFLVFLLSLFLVMARKKIWLMKCLNEKNRLLFFMVALLVVIIFSYCYGFISIRGKTILKSHFFYWLLAFCLLIENWRNKECVLGASLLLIPLCLSFGSDAAVYAKPLYLSFVTLAIGWFIEKKRHFVYMSFCVLLCLYGLIQGELMKQDWSGNKWLAQTQLLSSIGVEQKIKLDARNIEMVQNVREITNPKEQVLSDMFSWGLVELADLHPLSYSFRIHTDVAKQELERCMKTGETMNLLMLYDTESDFGSKQKLMEYMDSLGVIERHDIGYHRVLYRYEPK